MKDNVIKLVNRIKNSETFNYQNRLSQFDNGLVIDNYNNLYKIMLNGVTLFHIHADCKINPEENELYDLIYYAIQNRRDKQKQDLIDSL